MQSKALTSALSLLLLGLAGVGSAATRSPGTPARAQLWRPSHRRTAYRTSYRTTYRTFHPRTSYYRVARRWSHRPLAFAGRKSFSPVYSAWRKNSGYAAWKKSSALTQAVKSPSATFGWNPTVKASPASATSKVPAQPQAQQVARDFKPGLFITHPHAAPVKKALAARIAPARRNYGVPLTSSRARYGASDLPSPYAIASLLPVIPRKATALPPPKPFKKVAQNPITSPNPDAIRDEPIAKVRKVRLDFVNADIQEVFRALAAQSQANIIVSPDVKGSVTASLRNMTVDQALDAVSRMVGVAYRQVGDTYYVAPQARLDEMFSPPPITQTYAVHNGDATELASVVKAAIPSLSDATPAGKLLVVLKGPRESVEKGVELLTALDVPSQAPAIAPSDVVSRVRELHYLDNTTTVTRLTEVFGAAIKISEAPMRLYPQAKISSAGGSGAGGGGGGSEESNIVTSSFIIITGPKDLVDRASAMLDQLDTPPRQVEIQARVLDIATNKTSTRGIKWNWTNAFTFLEKGSVGSIITQGAGGGGATAQDGFIVTGNQFKIGSLQRSTPVNLDAQIAQAVDSGDARVLAEPSIRVVEGRTARIFIGDTLRVVIGRDVTPTGTTLQTQDFTPGITLVVSAHSTPTGEITMDVRPTVSVLTSLSAQGTDIPLPQISERSAQTVVRVHDGDTMVIGGLLQDQDVKQLSKVPGLGDLPFFGNLFRFRSITKRRSEVVIFITTRLVNP